MMLKPTLNRPKSTKYSLDPVTAGCSNLRILKRTVQRMTWSASPSRGKHAEFRALLSVSVFFLRCFFMSWSKDTYHILYKKVQGTVFSVYAMASSLPLRNRRVPWLPLRLFFENLHKYKCCSSVGTFFSRTPGPGKPGIQLPGSWWFLICMTVANPF